MFRQGQLAVHGLAILLGRNEAGISNRGQFFLHLSVRFLAEFEKVKFHALYSVVQKKFPPV